jgi:type VI secretion system protein ImpG
MGKPVMWRLISQLSLNHLSLIQPDQVNRNGSDSEPRTATGESGGRHALQEILRLYNFTESQVANNMIEGILDLQSERHFARVVSDAEISFARGTRVKMILNETPFGTGVYLFASVLEQFLAHYCTINSFSQLVVSTKQRREVLREWQPRAGRKILM